MSGRKIRVASSSEIGEGSLFAARPDGQRILLTRLQGKLYAVVDRCPHLGMSLAKGKLDGSVITCPWHSSRFDLCTGKNMDWVSAVLGVPMPPWARKVIAMGKSPAPLKTLKVEETGGEVLVTV